MSDQHPYTPEQEAQITQRIGQAFDFLSDVLADPSILDDIPTGATLRFGEVLIGKTVVHLTAYLESSSQAIGDQWTARVTAPAEWAAAGRKPVGRPIGAGGQWGSPPTQPEHGRTAEEALATLAEKLRDATRQFEADQSGSGQEGFRIA